MSFFMNTALLYSRPYYPTFRIIPELSENRNGQHIYGDTDKNDTKEFASL